MSEKLEQLAARLDSLNEPSDVMQKAQFSLLKAQGKALAHLPRVDGDVAQKREVLETCKKSIDTIAAMLGKGHEGIVILREMLANATAVVEGNPEPTDTELTKQIGGSGAENRSAYPLDPEYEAAKKTMDELDKWDERVTRIAIKAGGMSVSQARSDPFAATPIAQNLEIAERLTKLGYPDIEQRASAFIKKWKSGCFIATVCYETTDCSEVRQLRSFRDEVLLTSPLGRLLVGLYYNVSPPVADWLASRPRCRNAIRKHILQPMVRQLANRR